MEIEKSNEIPTLSQGTGSQSESEVNHALGIDIESPVQQKTNSKMERTWLYPRGSKRWYKHIDVGKKRKPEDIEHIPNGKRRGCQCAECKIARNEYSETPLAIESDSVQKNNDLDIPIYTQADVERIVSERKKDFINTNIDEDFEFLKDLLDEKTCGVLLDTFRAGGEMYFRGKYGEQVASAWERDETDIEVLGRMGKRCFEHYAKLPNWKYKDLMILGAVISRQLAMRIYGSVLIIKEMQKVKR